MLEIALMKDQTESDISNLIEKSQLLIKEYELLPEFVTKLDQIKLGAA